MLDSNWHVLAHVTPLLYLSSGHSMAHLSFLEHLDYHTLLQYNHIYIVIYKKNKEDFS